MPPETISRFPSVRMEKLDCSGTDSRAQPSKYPWIGQRIHKDTVVPRYPLGPNPASDGMVILTLLPPRLST